MAPINFEPFFDKLGNYWIAGYGGFAPFRPEIPHVVMDSNGAELPRHTQVVGEASCCQLQRSELWRIPPFQNLRKTC